MEFAVQAPVASPAGRPPGCAAVPLPLVGRRWACRAGLCRGHAPFRRPLAAFLAVAPPVYLPGSAAVGGAPVPSGGWPRESNSSTEQLIGNPLLGFRSGLGRADRVGRFMYGGLAGRGGRKRWGKLPAQFWECAPGLRESKLQNSGSLAVRVPAVNAARLRELCRVALAAEPS